MKNVVIVTHRAFEDESPVVVAEINVGDRDLDSGLEYAYFRTQNLEGSWSKGRYIHVDDAVYENHDYSEDITVLQPLRDGYGHRSTSVGDTLSYMGKTYMVDVCGFKEVR